MIENWITQETSTKMFYLNLSFASLMVECSYLKIVRGDDSDIPLVNSGVNQSLHMYSHQVCLSCNTPQLYTNQIMQHTLIIQHTSIILHASTIQHTPIIWENISDSLKLIFKTLPFSRVCTDFNMIHRLTVNPLMTDKQHSQQINNQRIFKLTVGIHEHGQRKRPNN